MAGGSAWGVTDQSSASVSQGPVKLRVSGVTHSYCSPTGQMTSALKDVDIKVRDHEFVALVGPSGCGKSTLLKHYGRSRQAEPRPGVP